MEVELNTIQEINNWKKFINTNAYKTNISNITIDSTWIEKHISFHFKKDNCIVGFNIDCRFENDKEFVVFKWNEEDTYFRLTENGFKLALKSFTERIKEYHDSSK